MIVQMLVFIDIFKILYPITIYVKHLYYDLDVVNLKLHLFNSFSKIEVTRPHYPVAPRMFGEGGALGRTFSCR